MLKTHEYLDICLKNDVIPKRFLCFSVSVRVRLVKIRLNIFSVKDCTGTTFV